MDILQSYHPVLSFFIEYLFKYHLSVEFDMYNSRGLDFRRRGVKIPQGRGFSLEGELVPQYNIPCNPVAG